MRGSMAMTFIGGLITNVLIVLLYVPALLNLLDNKAPRTTGKVKRLLARCKNLRNPKQSMNTPEKSSPQSSSVQRDRVGMEEIIYKKFKDF